MRVRGRSMEPTLHEGDVLLALRGAGIRPRDVVVVRLPPDPAGLPRPVAVKRIAGRDPDAPERWWVDSDNPREGVTSFDVGSLEQSAVEARVIARIWPRPGLLGRRERP